jgi:hypothetical protein
LLLETFNIEAAIAAIGETIRSAAVGVMRAQQTQNDRFLPPPGTSLNGGNILRKSNAKGKSMLRFLVSTQS